MDWNFQEILTWVIYGIVIWFMIDLISRTVLGGPLIEVIRGGRPSFRDADDQAHMRLTKYTAKAIKASKGALPKYLWSITEDRGAHASQPGGRLYLGKISGVGLWQTSVLIRFKKSMIDRSLIMIAPVDMLRSSESSVNVMVEGNGWKSIAYGDWCHPIPSASNKDYNEMDLHVWAMKYYNTLMTMQSDYTLRSFQEYLLIKAGSDPTALRMIQQGIGNMAKSTAAGDEDRQLDQESG